MKRIYVIITFLLILFIPFKIEAYTEGISNYYIDLTVQDNGDLYIKELIILNGEFNGFERIINYKNNRLSHFDGSLNSFRGSDIYNGSGINLIAIKDIAVDDNRSFDLLFNSGYKFEKVSSASSGDYGKYTRTVRSNGETYRIYNPSKGKERGFYLEYELKNVGVLHNDVAEVAINLFDELTEYVNILEMKIHIPNNSDLLRGWAHGPLTGEITLVNNNLIEVRASKIEKNNPIDVRFVFDKSVLNKSNKNSNVEALDKIIQVETELANDANAKREAARLQLEADAKNAVAYAKAHPTRENYNYALECVSYLPNGELKTSLQNELVDILKIVEQKENFYRITISVILISWIIGLVFLIRYIYKKYDKEYNPDFKGKYYREFPAVYGPEILGYLLNRKITPDDLSASIMYLISEKVISVEKVQNGKKNDYLLKRNKTTKQLTFAEDRLLTLVFDKEDSIKLDEFKKKAKSSYSTFLSNYDSWRAETLSVCKQENFFEQNNKKYLTILYLALGIFLAVTLYRNYVSFIIYVLIYILSIGSFIYLLTITKRTKKGNEDYSCWMGLKRFLKDFSMMDSRSLPEVALWEKYLVYAMPLGCAKQLSKDMKLKIKEINNYNPETVDMYDIGYMMRINNIISSSMVSSVQAAYTERTRAQMAEVSNSSSSSGGGFGGGFSSGGGSFGGGGGGGRF